MDIHGYQPVAPGAEIVRITPHVACVGVHLCALWLDQHHAFSPVVVQLRQAIASAFNASAARSSVSVM